MEPLVARVDGDNPRIRLLGEIQVASSDAEPTPVRGRPGLLLCVLALHAGQVLTPDRLTEDLWGDDRPQDPSNALHRVIVRLRQALPEPLADQLVTRRPGYSLRVPAGEVDVARFFESVDAGRRLWHDQAPALARVKLAEAQQLLRGEPFGGRTDLALAAVTARIQETALLADELLVDVDLALDDHHQALTRLEPLIAQHPLRERFTAQLMIARYRAGQQTEALEAYQRTRAALVAELGVEPGPDLATVHQSVLRHDPALRPHNYEQRAAEQRAGSGVTAAGSERDEPEVRTLPTLPMVGREQLLGALHDARHLALDGRQVLVDLVGEAGSGRTRLLAAFAASLPDEDVASIAAYPTDRSEPGAVFGRLPESARPRPRVVLVDDATDADATSLTQLARLLADSNGCLMVWARRATVGLPPQPAARLIQGAASTGEVVQLRLHRLTTQEVGSWFVPGTDAAVPRALVEASSGVARELVRVVTGLITAGDLQRRPHGLAALRTPDAADLADAEFASESSDAHLLNILAVAGRPVPLRVLAATLGLDRTATLDRLRPMINEGVAREDPRGALPAGAVDVDRVVARLGEVGKTSILEELADAWVEAGVDQDDAAAVGGFYLTAQRPGDALPLLAAASLRADEREGYHEALPVIEGALLAATATDADDQLRGRLTLARAYGRSYTGPMEAALSDALAAIRLLRGTERQRARVVAATVAVNLRRHEVVDDLLRAARTHADGGHDGHLSELLTVHAIVHGERGEHDLADADVDAAVREVDTSDEPRPRARTYLNAGWIALERGQAGIARQRLSTAIATGGLAETDHEVNVRLYYARALFLTGEIDDAVANHRRAARRIAAERPTGMASLAAGTLALGLLNIGRSEDALTEADEMLALAPHASLTHEIAARTRRALALAGSGKTDEAVQETEIALDLCPDGPGTARLRLPANAIAARVASGSSRPWSLAAMEELVDQLDAACRPLNVAEMLTASVAIGAPPAHAERAARIALDLGSPMHAARASEAGNLWASDLGAATSERIQAMAAHVPRSWREEWAALPEVMPALRGAHPR